MKTVINKFVQDKKVGIVGASRNPKKWGAGLTRILVKKGYTVYPVNPNAEKIEGLTCYATVKKLPKDVSNVIVSLPVEKTLGILRECSGTGVKRIWLHKGVGGAGASSPVVVEAARQAGLEVVYGLCPLMFFPRPGIHKVHLWFKKLGGKLPTGL